MAASTQVITDTSTAISTGPSAATKANAIAAAGKIMDYPGNLNLVLGKFQEAKELLTQIISDTDSEDGSLTTLNNILLTLS